jgi:hypothetical protein
MNYFNSIISSSILFLSERKINIRYLYLNYRSNFAFNIIGRSYVTQYNFENIMNLINIFYKL